MSYRIIDLFISYRSIVGLAGLVVSLAVFTACDNTVDPFAEGGGHAYAVFGYLDTEADTQFVRISRVRPDEALSGGVGDPPIVTTTNVQTNESVTWTDSVVVLEDGALGRIYFASFKVQASVTYRMDVSDEGVARTRAVTTVPEGSGIVPHTPHRTRSGDLEQRLLWQDLPRARDPRMHYHVRGLSTGKDTTIVLSYIEFGGSSPRGWAIDVTLSRDFRLVRRFAEFTIGDTSLVLLDLSMSLEAPSAEWTAAAGASNIENGSGFFASVARLRAHWTLDPTTLRSIGYQTP